MMRYYSLYDPNFQREFTGNSAPSQANFSQRFNNFNDQNQTGSNPFQAYMTSSS